MPSNLYVALRAILVAAFKRDGAEVTGEAILSCVMALSEAVEATTAYCADYPLPSTVDHALRSAGGIARVVGTPRAEWSVHTCETLPCWIDWVMVLMAEVEATACWRRLAARLGQDWSAMATTDSRPQHH